MILHLENQILKRERLGNLRQLQTKETLIDFSSNDYLGLSLSTALKFSVLEEWSKNLYKLGSTGSRLLTGNDSYVEMLEMNIAKFHGFEAGLIFNCGYMANLGLLSVIASHKDTIFFDAAIHASTYDGIRLKKAKAFPFKHNDLEHLENRLKNCSCLGNRWICIESIYSTDGTTAPLKEICHLAKKYQAKVIVDEAHAVGVCGIQGHGLVAKHNLTRDVFAQVTTFGKALGTHGAIVLGSHTLKKALINFATPYIYTTALPFYTLAAIKCSYDLFPKLQKEREHLQHLIQIFKQHAPISSQTHIQAIHIKGNEAVKQASKKLKMKGFDVRPLMSPTVQKGHEVLRISLHAFNREIEIKDLLKAIYE